jgi:tetratricopeptide (TPR) repeat protein
MKPLSLAGAFLFIAACATLESQSEFLTGRRALLRGEPDNALSAFDRVARSNAGFITDSVSPRRSIWTYVGRAHYNSGRYAEARAAFEKALSQLSDDHIARLYLGLTILHPSAPSAPSKAFSLQEVTYALREGVEPKRVATLARERGVAFDLTKETESQLQTVGADQLLLSEIRNIRAQSAKKNQTGETQRAQAGRELTAALTGLRDWLDYTVAYTPQGKFWDPSEQIRKQIAFSLKLVAARPTDWETLISNAESVGSMLEEENDRARRDESAERERQLRR